MTICKYYQFNSCHFNNKCRFLHREEWKYCKKKSCADNCCIYLHDRPICKYYQVGTCFFGDGQCWYSHETKSKKSQGNKDGFFISNKISVQKKPYVPIHKPKRTSGEGRKRNFKYKKKIKKLQSELSEIKTQLASIQEIYKNDMLKMSIAKDTVSNHSGLITLPEKEKSDNQVKLMPCVENKTTQRDKTVLQQSGPEELRTEIPSTNICRTFNMRCTIGSKASENNESPVGETHQNVSSLGASENGRSQSFSKNQAELLEAQNESQYFSELKQNNKNTVLEKFPVEKIANQTIHLGSLSDLWELEEGVLRFRPGLYEKPRG